MSNKSLTYQKMELISKQQIFSSNICHPSQKKKKRSNSGNIGGFGSISDIPDNIKNPKIVACTDECWN